MGLKAGDVYVVSKVKKFSVQYEVLVAEEVDKYIVRDFPQVI